MTPAQGVTPVEDCLVLGPGDVERQLKVMEVLTSSVKRSILGLLARSPGGLAAKEIAESLGVSLPTVLEHLESLVSSGLVRLEDRGRRSKVYKLVVDCIQMRIELKQYYSLGEDSLKELALRFLEEKLSQEKGRLSIPVGVREVARVLGLDRRTAARVAMIINRDRSLVTSLLEPRLLKLLSEKPLTSVAEVAERLSVDNSIAALLVMELVERGLVTTGPRGISLAGDSGASARS